MTIEEILKIIQEDQKTQSIGTKQEKTIHLFIKYYLSNDKNNHEVKINKNIVDVFLNNHIYEIQTKSFNLLRDKLKSLLLNYKLTIVYPIYVNTWMYKVNENDEILYKRKSPRKECIFSIGDELYKIKMFLEHSNLSFKIIAFNCLEYKKERINKYHQTRLTSIDRVPTEIVDIYDINDYHDWVHYLSITEPFTKNDFKTKYHLTLKQAGCMLNVLRDLELIKVTGKNKKAYIYEIMKSENQE